MNQSFYGSLNITKLLDELKSKHSGFYKGSDGKIYANVQVWLNENTDKYGNVMSIKINPHKDKKESETPFYLGNCKKSDGPKSVADNDISGIDVDTDSIDERPAKNAINPNDDTDLPF